jgi:hypothetical protein
MGARYGINKSSPKTTILDPKASKTNQKYQNGAFLVSPTTGVYLLFITQQNNLAMN